MPRRPERRPFPVRFYVFIDPADRSWHQFFLTGDPVGLVVPCAGPPGVHVTARMRAAEAEKIYSRLDDLRRGYIKWAAAKRARELKKEVHTSRALADLPLLDKPRYTPAEIAAILSKEFGHEFTPRAVRRSAKEWKDGSLSRWPTTQTHTILSSRNDRISS